MDLICREFLNTTSPLTGDRVIVEGKHYDIVNRDKDESSSLSECSLRKIRCTPKRLNFTPTPPIVQTNVSFISNSPFVYNNHFNNQDVIDGIVPHHFKDLFNININCSIHRDKDEAGESGIANNGAQNIPYDYYCNTQTPTRRLELLTGVYGIDESRAKK